MFTFRSKKLFDFFKLIHFISPIMSFIGIAVMHLKYFTIYDMILFGIPWNIIFTFYACFNQSAFILYLFYFNSICLYFKLKVARKFVRMNQFLMSRDQRFSHLMKIMVHLNKVYLQVNRFNNEFWSRQLPLSLIFNFVMLSCLTHIVFFVQIDPLFMIVLSYLFLINLSTFVSLVISTASLTSKVRKIFLLKTRIFIAKKDRFHPLSKIKVNAKN